MSSRRTFFKTTFLTTLVMVMSQSKLFASVTPLQTFAVLQEDLFPQKFISKSNALTYMSLVFKHSRVSASDKQFLRNGTKWLHEEAVATYGEVYTKLSASQRENILQKIAKESWGEAWIKRVLSYIMEAILGDPIYGINKNEFAWRWLGHESGLPRPKEIYL